MTVDEIRAVLRNRHLRVIRYEGNYFTVIWSHQDKIKYGQIKDPYLHRYGINTMATFNGKRFWFQSGEIGDNIPNVDLTLMKNMSEGLDDGLDEFDPDSIDVAW